MNLQQLERIQDEGEKVGNMQDQFGETERRWMREVETEGTCEGDMDGEIGEEGEERGMDTGVYMYVWTAVWSIGLNLLLCSMYVRT